MVSQSTARLSVIVTNRCDSRQYTEPSPQQSMTPLLAEFMTLKQLGGAAIGTSFWNSTINPHSFNRQLPLWCMPVLRSPWVHMGVIWAFLGPAGSSAATPAHCWITPHCVSLWPLSSRDDTGSSSQGADLTHSPQSTATSHMPASSVILTRH